MTCGTAERQAVHLRQAGVAVGPFQELVSERRPPSRRHLRRILDRPQTVFAGIRTADENHELVIETERAEERPSAARIKFADGRDDALPIGRWLLVKYRGKGRAGVFT